MILRRYLLSLVLTWIIAGVVFVLVGRGWHAAALIVLLGYTALILDTAFAIETFTERHASRDEELP